MFGKKWSTEALVTTQVIPRLIAPVGREVTTIPLEDNERIAYERTCKAIGFEPAALLEARVLSFFKEKGIRIFDYAEVSAYMKQKAEAKKKIWHWRPLRAVDGIMGWQWESFDSYSRLLHDYYNSKNWNCRPYSREVPLRVLATVEQIHGEFGDQVKFFVTDYSVPRPDPFIAVVALDMPRLVFDYWDEPDFGASLTL